VVSEPKPATLPLAKRVTVSSETSLSIVCLPTKCGFYANAPVVSSAGAIRTIAAVIAVANTVIFLILLSDIFPRLLVTTNVNTRFETIRKIRYPISEPSYFCN
jgi:hypothetical protein